MILDNGSDRTPAGPHSASVLSVDRPGLSGVQRDLEHLKLQISIPFMSRVRINHTVLLCWSGTRRLKPKYDISKGPSLAPDCISSCK